MRRGRGGIEAWELNLELAKPAVPGPHGHLKCRARFNQINLLDDTWPPLNEPMGLFEMRHAKPRARQEEDRQARLSPRFSFVAISEYALVRRNDDPVALLTQRREPLDVRCVHREPVPQVANLVTVRLDQNMKSGRKPWRQIVVEQCLQAASCRSKATASRIMASGTSYQRAAALTEPSAFTASAKTAVGILPSDTMG